MRRKTIILNENTVNDIKKEMILTNFKFYSNLKKFLSGILEDPVGTDVEYIFKCNGLDKNKLLQELIDNKIIKKHMTINDHDAEGNPQTAKMLVKYVIPKKDFKIKVKNLYNKLSPSFTLNEDGGGACSCSGVGGGIAGADSGQYSQPLFGKIIKRKDR